MKNIWPVGGVGAELEMISGPIWALLYDVGNISSIATNYIVSFASIEFEFNFCRQTLKICFSMKQVPLFDTHTVICSVLEATS